MSILLFAAMLAFCRAALVLPPQITTSMSFARDVVILENTTFGPAGRLFVIGTLTIDRVTISVVDTTSPTIPLIVATSLVLNSTRMEMIYRSTLSPRNTTIALLSTSTFTGSLGEVSVSSANETTQCTRLGINVTKTPTTVNGVIIVIDTCGTNAPTMTPTMVPPPTTTTTSDAPTTFPPTGSPTSTTSAGCATPVTFLVAAIGMLFCV